MQVEQPEPAQPVVKQTNQEFLDEIERHLGDISDVRLAVESGGLNPDQMKQMLKQVMDANENMLSNMDANTKIGKIPMAWCDTSLSWSGVNYKVRDTVGNEHHILQDCAGHVPSGNLVAIMGPSGCGKSTLLDILAQKKTTPYEGNVYCNGNDVRGDKFFRRYSTYVPQADDMHEVLTVKETVLFDVALKTPLMKNVNTDPDPLVRERWPDFFLSILGLSHVKNTVIGGSKSGLRGVSGGQKRRVTLARGAVSSAQLLFADEPTSGLSATDAETCIKMLRFLCKRVGLTCLVVIHQPRVEVAELFDHLILLTANPRAYGGSVVYNGPMNGTIMHCERVGYPVPQRANPADWLMDMITPGYKHVLVKSGDKQVDESVRDFVQYYKRHEAPAVQATVDNALQAPGVHPMKLATSRFEHLQGFFNTDAMAQAPDPRVNSVYGTNFFTQVRLLLSVKLKLLARDKKGLRMNVGMSIMQGLIVGVAYWDIGSKSELSHITYIFMIMQFTAIGGMQIMPGLVDLRNVMKKDCDEGLHSIPAWILSNSLPDVVLNVATNSVFIVIAFAMGNMDWEIFCTFYYWVLLCSLVMDSYFNLIAAMAPNGQIAQLMAMPVMIMFMLFNGFFVSKESTPDFMMWALYTSPFFYAISRLAIDVYGPDACDTIGCSQAMGTYGFLDGPSEELAFSVLVWLFVLFRILQVFALTFMNKPER